MKKPLISEEKLPEFLAQKLLVLALKHGKEEAQLIAGQQLGVAIQVAVGVYGADVIGRWLRETAHGIESPYEAPKAKQ